jgi:uncharacterized membrane protein
MESELFGLPTHPLVVHAVVVLLPLAAIGTILGAVWPAARRHLIVATIVFAVSSVVLVPLATSSGEELQDQVDRTSLVHEHAEMGNQAIGYAIAVLIGAAGVALVEGMERWGEVGEDGTISVGGRSLSASARRTLGIVVIVVALTTSVAGLYGIARIGHSGAQATWDRVSSAGG